MNNQFDQQYGIIKSIGADLTGLCFRYSGIFPSCNFAL